jgi:hypothetical protein
MFHPMPRETFLADATDIVGTTRLDLPLKTGGGPSHSSTRCTRGGCMRDVLWRRRGVRVVRKPVLKEVDNV